jgi:hypothetical protein
VRRLISALLAACIGALGVPAVQADPGAAARESRDACEWLAGDFHVHTTYSHDSWGPIADDNTGPDEFYTWGWSPAEQARIAASRGLNFVAITDHNDVRSASADNRAAIQAQGLIAVPGYENSLPGHAQFVGVDEVLDNGEDRVQDLTRLKNQLHARDGFFQINHPSDFDWIRHYGGAEGTIDEAMVRAVDAFQPDSLEVWNISPGVWQPPLPAANDDDFSLRFYDEFLKAGHRVAATGGSDNHWRTTTAAQGVGQPTTWVCAEEGTSAGITDAVRASRTTLSSQPPAHAGTFVTMQADDGGDGRFESMIGDTVVQGATIRVRVERGAGTVLALIADGEVAHRFDVTTNDQTFELPAPADASYLRAEAYYDDAPEVRAELQPLCDAAGSTHCESRFAMAALTSPIYLAEKHGNGSTYAEVTEGHVALGNPLVERRWDLTTGRSTMIDKRAGSTWATARDFTIIDRALGAIGSETLDVAGVDVDSVERGLRLVFDLRNDFLSVRRTVTVYQDIAGFRSDVRFTSDVPLHLTGLRTDGLVPGDGASATSHSFRAGADWRQQDGSWEPELAIGEGHGGTWRETKTAAPGGSLSTSAQYLSLEAGGARLALVLERADLPSSVVRFGGDDAHVGVDFTRDIVSAGPFEESAHAEHPDPATGAGRVKQVAAGTGYELPTTFISLGTDADDEHWQFFEYLRDHRMPDYDKDVTFNSNGTDDNVISTGAKDDMDFATVQQVAPLARRLGVETFILDDGWQAISGDWCPDSPECRDPQRFDPTAPQEGTFQFSPRFPDSTFDAVRAEIAPMKLGLWMNAMHFHPASQTFKEHPDWNCHPVSDALVAANAAEPNSSSNEAGIATWSTRAIPHVESRIRNAIENWHAEYFKFDFLVWLECVGANDMWEYKERFAAMVDRLQADYPDVTFQIDETNDYRLFPFDSIVRGPSWFQNGSPLPHQLLHNIHNLSPWIPAFSLGQHFLGGRQYETYPVSTLMAVALTSHMTFFSDLRSVPVEVLDQARPWIDFYKAHREHFTQMIHPLLADPMEQRWTALQSWDPERGMGALLAFRQKDASSTVTIALEQVPGGMTFRLIEAPTGELVGEFTSAQLDAGLEVTIPDEDGARVFVIQPT